MGKDLSRRIRKAKRAQARRSPSLQGGKKKCRIGKSCGATCIARHEICAVDLADQVSSDVSKASDTVTSNRQGGGDKLASEFSRHIRENSFTIPGSSYDGNDIANLVNQAAERLSGEAKENLNKMRQFVTKDNQLLFVSITKNELLSSTSKGKRSFDWAVSDEYLKALDRSYIYSKMYESFPRELKLNLGFNSSSFRDAYAKFIRQPLEAEEEIRRLTAELRKEGANIGKLNKLISIEKRSIESHREQLASVKEGLAKLMTPLDGVGGFTSSYGKFVALVDYPNGNGPTLSKGLQVRVGNLRDNVSSVMSLRAKASNFPDMASLDRDTFTFAHRLKGTNLDVLANYVHEVGHQVHYRAGSPNPPADSPSLSRVVKGITGYSGVSIYESFAEAFVAFTFYPEALRRQDEPLYNWVKSSLDSSLGVS